MKWQLKKYLPEEFSIIEKPYNWDKCMMEEALGMAKMSKDPDTKVGCVIVSPDKTRITGGYNGFPQDIPDVREWWENRNTESESFCKYDLVLHAEENAIIQAKTDLTGWTMYVTRHPCLHCALMIVKAKITRVVFIDKTTNMDLKRAKGDLLFNIAGIEISKLEGF